MIPSTTSSSSLPSKTDYTAPNLQEKIVMASAWSLLVCSSMRWPNPVQGTSNKNGNVDNNKKVQISLHCKSECVKDMTIRDRKRRETRGKAALQTNHCHAFPSNYRHMKYELQLIFLPGVTVLCVLRTLGIYLGSKLTSFCRATWAV